ncbi:hypothetical protein F5Y14DRAFT_346752 [Nemania sp. NC0429]|nr:hypothetical protein F5Y14DRAFT_346752 [Nemania sp. NC0429]
MHLPTSLAFLGSILTITSGAAISSSFALGAVDLASGSATPLAVEPTEASVRILRASTNSTASSPQLAFTYDAAARRLQNALYGPSDLVRPNVTVTFAEFEAPADGLLALRQNGSAAYLVYASGGNNAGGRVDGWSLCGVTAFYWSGNQAPLAGCAKVALEMR